METWLLGFAQKWKDFFPLVGSGATIIAGILIAFYATWRLNRSMKQTEFFLKFTERFHNILQSKHQLDLRLEEKDPTTNANKIDDATAKKEAREIYRQLFGLMFDEFFAYQQGFLARRAFVEWMRWRNYEYRDNDQGHANFTIGPVSYKQGWEKHTESPVVRSEFAEFLNKIHNIDPTQGSLEVQIEKVVLQYRRRRRPPGRIQLFLSEYSIIMWLVTAVLSGYVFHVIAG